MTLLIPSPLGTLLATADEEALLSLNFASDCDESSLYPTKPLLSVAKELEEYFQGKRTSFATPIRPTGTPFQIKVWQELSLIPFGRTASYAYIAQAMGKKGSSRAVGHANGKNPFLILIPCHRIIQSDGKLGGYTAGLFRKSWLLDHEKRYTR